MKLLKPIEVTEKLGVPYRAFYYFRVRKPSFPQPIKLGPKTFRYDEDEINAWLESCKATPEEDQTND